MTDKKQEPENWLSSKEAKKVFKVSDCHLMHLRQAGKLQFRKEGIRFFICYQSSRNSGNIQAVIEKYQQKNVI